MLWLQPVHNPGWSGCQAVADLRLCRRHAHPTTQVVVAVDDSRSMAETGCGAFALEALTLICRSMARLEVRRFIACSAAACPRSAAILRC